MKKIILLSTLLIVGCATKPVISPKPTVYFDGMSEEIFKEKNDELEVVEQTKDGIVYLRKNILNVIYNTMYLCMVKSKQFHHFIWNLIKLNLI